jgi:RNA polymerase sigma-70 factor, ECF subfamily
VHLKPRNGPEALPRPPQAGTDERVLAATRGDRAAAEALLRELLPRIRNLSRALLGTDRDVDDVSQQVLMQVMKGLASFRGDGTLSAWCDRITVRTAIAHARRSRAEALESLSEEGTDSGSESGSDDYLARRDAVKVLDSLPVEQRSAMVLHHLLGYSVPEIAAHEGISADTVKSRLRLAMTRLRARLEHEQRAS